MAAIAGTGVNRWLAGSVSLLVHALLGLVAWLVLGSVGMDEPADGRVVDTRVQDKDLVLLEDYRPLPIHLAAVGSPGQAAPIVPTIDGGAEEAAEVPAAGPSPAFAPGRPGGTAPGAGASFSGVAFRGRSVVFVLDRSASMGQHGRFGTALQALTQCLERLPVEVRFQVIAYNRTAEPLRLAGQSTLAAATAANLRAALSQLQAVLPEGSTDHAAALHRALALNADVIYFLTDADDLQPETVRQLTQRNGGRSVIHALRPGLSMTDDPLQLLARLNGGEFRERVE